MQLLKLGCLLSVQRAVEVSLAFNLPLLFLVQLLYSLEEPVFVVALNLEQFGDAYGVCFKLADQVAEILVVH